MQEAECSSSEEARGRGGRGCVGGRRARRCARVLSRRVFAFAPRAARWRRGSSGRGRKSSSHSSRMVASTSVSRSMLGLELRSARRTGRPPGGALHPAQADWCSMLRHRAAQSIVAPAAEGDVDGAGADSAHIIIVSAFPGGAFERTRIGRGELWSRRSACPKGIICCSPPPSPGFVGGFVGVLSNLSFFSPGPTGRGGSIRSDASVVIPSLLAPHRNGGWPTRPFSHE